MPVALQNYMYHLEYILDHPMQISDVLIKTSSETMEGIHAVRTELVSCAIMQQLFPSLSQDVPKTWMQLLQVSKQKLCLTICLFFFLFFSFVVIYLFIYFSPLSVFNRRSCT